MKKLLWIGLFILTACNMNTTEPAPPPTATATRLALTPVPATATITVTPSPTLASTPPLRYFTEEFDTASNNWATLYASGQPNTADVQNQNNALVFALSTPNAWWYAIFGLYEYEAVHVEASIASSGSDVNAMGLVCHYNEQAGWYEFNIASDGNYNVLYGQWLDEGIARYERIASDTTEYIHTGPTSNEIGLDCYDTYLQIYINGKLFRKLDVSRYGLTGGKIGVSAASFSETPVILAFDWVKVSLPDPYSQ